MYPLHGGLQALLRRLEKRVLVPLPNAVARAAMFSKLLAGRCAADVDWQQLARATEGYSGGYRAAQDTEAAPPGRCADTMNIVYTSN